MKKIILLSTLVVLGSLVLTGVPFGSVFAASPTLSVLPATASKTAGTAFNVSVQIDPQGNKICVVSGTLSFDNLTCSGVTVASGLMAQTTPTCKSPSFTLGIPKCTTAVQNILTVSVKGNQAGTAKASVASAKVIGVGVVIAPVANGGTYSITETPAPAPTPTPTTTPEVTQPATQPAQAPVQQTPPANNIPVSAGAASFASVASAYFWPLLIILIILCVGYGIYYLVKRKKK